jgi:hypothetical protein
MLRLTTHRGGAAPNTHKGRGLVSDTDEERRKIALDHHESICARLVEERTLTLTVVVNTKEDAEQILEWMYAKEKPMSAVLEEMAWDKVSATPEVMEAVGVLTRWANTKGEG